MLYTTTKHQNLEFMLHWPVKTTLLPLLTSVCGPLRWFMSLSKGRILDRWMYNFVNVEVRAKLRCRVGSDGWGLYMWSYKEHLIDRLCVYEHVTWGKRGQGLCGYCKVSIKSEVRGQEYSRSQCDCRGWAEGEGGGWRKGCNGAAGGSPGLLINKLVGCSPRFASDSHCPHSSLICLSSSLVHTNNLRRLLLDCVLFYVAHTHNHIKTSEFHHESRGASGLVQAVLTVLMMRGSEKHTNTFTWILSVASLKLNWFSKYSCLLFCFPVFPCVPEKPGMPCLGEDSKLNLFSF